MNAGFLTQRCKGAKTQRERFIKLFASLRLCTFALILLSGLSHAQTPAPTPTPFQPNELHQWGAVTMFHGLPSDRVRAIAQGPDGALWFGTDAGLARYDGRRTQTIAGEGLPAGRVLALQFDADNALWLGTDGGAARLHNSQFQPVKETAGQPVNAILLREKGSVLFATDKGQVFATQVNNDAFTPREWLREPLPSADADRPGLLPLTSLAYHNGTLYAGSLSRGVFALRDDGTAEEIYSRPRSYFVNALAANEQLWTGVWTSKTGRGVADSSEVLRPQPADVPTGTVLALNPYAQSAMWVGTDGQGAFHLLDGKVIKHLTFANTAGGLRSDHIYTIFIDREGIVWFGTDKGVSRYDANAPQVEKVGDNASSNFIRTLLLPFESTDLAGTNRGLFALSDETGATWQQVPDLGGSTIYAADISDDAPRKVAVGASSGLYVATENGNQLSFQKFTPALIDKDGNGGMRAVKWWRNGLYFVTYGRGLERWAGDHATLLWPTEGQPEREILSLTPLDENRLWLGTAGAGVFVYDGQQVQPVQELAILKGVAVRDILPDVGGIWCATAKGLYFYRTGDAPRLIVPQVDARSLTPSLFRTRPAVWCATLNAGVLQVVLDEIFGPLISRLDAEQGLPSNSTFAVWQPKKPPAQTEPMLIATNRGLVSYGANPNRPTLTPARILSKRVHAAEEARGGLRLEYPQNSLLLEMSAIASRTFPEQFQYGFRLLDAKGQVVAQKLSRDAQFTMENLKAGRYRVEAVAFSRDLVASEPFAFDLQVERAPFPWFTLSLGIMLALSLAALWWGGRKNAQLVQTGAELRDARERLAHEAESERRRIARDLHDQTLADLRRLALLTDELPAAQGKASHLRGEIEEVSQEIRRICEDLSPSVLENVGLAAALEFALSQAVAQAPPERKFSYEFSCDDDLEEKLTLTPAAQIQLFRIVQEAVSNISRHAQARHVAARAEIDARGAFVFTLTDDGRTFSPDAPHAQGRGLANLQARADLIAARVSWTAAPQGGTIFRLRVHR